MCENNSIKSRSDIHRKLGSTDLNKSNYFLVEKTLHLFAFVFVILIISLFFTSCVSSKKLIASEARCDEL